MKNSKWILILITGLVVELAGGFAFASVLPRASTGLVIHAVEIGTGKFHRYDNQVHPYSDQSIWRPYILPDHADLQTPLVVDQPDGSFSIFFSSLQELLETVKRISTEKSSSVSILNILGHGMPGGMWFPMDQQEKDSLKCYSWNEAANAPDEDNYDQYYSPISKQQIMQVRAIANSTSDGTYPCVTGLKEWQQVVSRLPGLKQIFSPEAQVHFFSCTVGLGVRGDKFTKGIAALLLSSDQGRVETSLPFGLGDWSMNEGMSFWDYQNDDQLKHDNAEYVKNKKDAEQMQKGDIRVAFLRMTNANQPEIISGLIQKVDYLFPGKDLRQPSVLSPEISTQASDALQLPEVFQLPGTKAILHR